MKKLLFIPLIALAVACNTTPTNEGKVTTISTDSIVSGGIVHDSLSPAQLEKIQKIQATFEEVYAMTLEQTITNFKKDQNPDNEIAVWLLMAEAYTKYLTKHTDLDLTTKKDVFKLVLSRSMMPEQEAIKNAKLSVLNETQAKEVLSYYTAEPEPIKTGTK